MHNNDMTEQVKRLMAEMAANRLQLQKEIGARQKAEQQLRDFAATRNVRILQATEEALKSAWQELEEKGRVIKEQQLQILALETRLAQLEQEAAAVEPAPVEPDAAEAAVVVLAPEEAGFVEAAPDEPALAEAASDEPAPAAQAPVDAAADADEAAQAQPAPVDAAAPPALLEAAFDELAPAEPLPAPLSPWYVSPRVHEWLESLPEDSRHQGPKESSKEATVHFMGAMVPLASLQAFVREEPALCALILEDINKGCLAEAEMGARRLREAAREIGSQELEEQAGEVEASLKRNEERIFVIRRVVDMENALKLVLEEAAHLLENRAHERNSVPLLLANEGDSPQALLRYLGELLADGSDEASSFIDEHGIALSDYLEPDEWEDFIHLVRSSKYEIALHMIEYYM